MSHHKAAASTLVDVNVPHTPVMLREVLALVERFLPSSGAKVWDATFGRGGHLSAIWTQYSARIQEVWITDQDLCGLEYARRLFSEPIGKGQFKLCHGRWSELDLPSCHFDFILADIGVSSPQIDDPQRGFSFLRDGPLDMRMDQTRSFKAEDIVNDWSEKELVEIFRKYGEVPNPFPVVRKILSERKKKPIQSTLQLASIIEKTMGWRKRGFHPATLFFQALRICVNDELGELERGLKSFHDALVPGGVLIVISFHSLEDRLIKHQVKNDYPDLQPVFKKPQVPQDDEKKANPRSRSAKLRAYRKVGFGLEKEN